MKMVSQSTTISKGRDAFCLDYAAKWPMNLIFSKRAITKYQLLFRHLFNLKIVSIELGEIWNYEMGNKAFNSFPAFMLSYNLR